MSNRINHFNPPLYTLCFLQLSAHFRDNDFSVLILYILYKNIQMGIMPTFLRVSEGQKKTYLKNPLPV